MMSDIPDRNDVRKQKEEEIEKQKNPSCPHCGKEMRCVGKKKKGGIPFYKCENCDERMAGDVILEMKDERKAERKANRKVL